jgi:hypothetical protein
MEILARITGDKANRTTKDVIAGLAFKSLLGFVSWTLAIATVKYVWSWF